MDDIQYREMKFVGSAVYLPCAAVIIASAFSAWPEPNQLNLSATKRALKFC